MRATGDRDAGHGAEDVAEDGVHGFIVPARDVGAIAERLRLLDSDPDLRMRMARAARKQAEAFTWRRYGMRMVQLAETVRSK